MRPYASGCGHVRKERALPIDLIGMGEKEKEKEKRTPAALLGGNDGASGPDPACDHGKMQICDGPDNVAVQIIEDEGVVASLVG